MFFLDTNACIAFLRGTSPSLRRNLLAQSPSAIRLAAIVEAELLFGARNSQQAVGTLAATRSFLQMFQIVPFDSAAAEQYSIIRFDLQASGQIIGPNDLLIAATVLAANGTLVTHDTAEFARVNGLKVVDWE